MAQQTLKIGNLSKVLILTKDQSYDVTSLVNIIEVTEGIFRPFITGRLLITEPRSVSIFKGKKIPTDFSSKVDFSFSGLEDDGTSQQREIKISGQDYYIYKILPGTPTGGNQQTEVFFAHKSMFANEGLNMSRSFKKKKISDIVSEVGSSKLQVNWGEVEQTDKEFSFVLPYRTPVSQIMFLTPYARSQSNPNDVNYVFYQTLDGKHNFVSIGNLISKGPSFGSDKTTGFVFTLNRGEDFSLARRAILQHTARESNQFQNALNGMHALAVMTLDTCAKIWSATSMFLPQVWGSQQHLSNKPVVDNSSEFYDIVNGAFSQRFYAKSRHSHCCKEQKNGNNKIGGEDDWLLKRVSSMEQMNQHAVEFYVTGNSDINKVSAGKVVFVGRAMMDNGESDDILYSGKFLISTITHRVTSIPGSPIQYGCYITALKDSIGDE